MNIAKVMLIQNIIEEIELHLRQREKDGCNWTGVDDRLVHQIDGECIGLKTALRIIKKNALEEI